MLLMIILAAQSNSSKRILDIYAIDAHDKTYINQLQLLNKDEKGLNERDIVIKTHLGSPGFKIVLTGKDGGEKYSSSQILTPVKLYAIIDAMPMRKEEMRKR